MRPVRAFLTKLATMHGTPLSIAGGFSLGMGLSLVPVPFAGMALALALAPVFRLHLPATYLGTAVINPVTGSAFYFAELWIGMWLLQREPPSWQELRALDVHGWWDLLLRLAGPFLLGACVLVTFCAVVVFPSLWWLTRKLQSARASTAAGQVPASPISSAEVHEHPR